MSEKALQPNHLLAGATPIFLSTPPAVVPIQ